jgi:hypothetical protein
MHLRLLASRLFRWSSRSAYALAFGLVVLGIDVVGLIESSQLMRGIEGLAIIYGICKLSSDIWKDWARYQRIYEQQRHRPLLVEYEPPYDSWSSITLGPWHAIHDYSLDHKLTVGKKIQVERVSRRWKPATRMEETRGLRRLSLDFDEKKIRLTSDILTSSTAVTLQRVPYSAFLVTNKLGIVDVKERGDRTVLSAEDVILHDGLLTTFERSKCSNHLGADTLAVVDDGRILITRQTTKNQLSKGLLAPSGSGSIDWKDLHREDDLVTMVKRAMRREMSEELGIARPDVPDLLSMRVLGYARLTHLGGKPQFFGVARLRSANERIRGIERRYISDHVTIYFTPRLGVGNLLSAVAKFEKDRLPEMSFPLYINLQMFKRWVTVDPDAINWLRLTPQQ